MYRAASGSGISTRLVAAFVAAAVAVLGLVAPTAALAAPAESDGVTLTVDYGDQTYDGRTVVEPGVDYTASLAYDLTTVEPGSSREITVPDGVVFPTGVPAGNDAIASITQSGDTLTVTFEDDFAGTAQGFIDMVFQFTDPAGGSAVRDVSWELDGVSTEQTVIVKEPGDAFQPDIADDFAKDVGGHGLDGAVSYDQATGAVTVDPAVTGLAIPYTLTVDSASARTGATITDTISDYLEYDPAGFTAELTTWDEDGLNRTTAAFPLPAGQPTITGRSFTLAGLDIPEQSVLVISYAAHVAADQVDDLEAALQAQADEIDSSVGGDFSVSLDNGAAIDGGAAVTRTATITAHKPREPQPGPGSAFTKSSDLADPYALDPDGDGVLDLPVPVTYTLTADLTQFDLGTHPDYDGKYALTDDVIVTDTLPNGLEWTGAVAAAAPNALTAFAGTAADFAADSDEGEYLIDGQTLRVNVGEDVTRNWRISAGARIVSVDSLPSSTNTGSPQIREVYTVGNSATFAYTDGRGSHSYTASKSNPLHVQQPDGSEITDPAAFAKTVGALPQMTIGEAYQVPYTFTIAAGAVVDLAQSRIIDTVNHDVFDVTADDLDAIRSTASGAYDGTAIEPDDIALSLVDDELVIELSATGEERLRGGSADPLDGALTLTLDLPTHVVQGKQTLDVSNSARVEGGTRNDYIWLSTAQASATSYGNELEVRKSVYEGAGDWTQNLRVTLDEDGDPTQTTFIYRVQMFPHGSFAGHAILDIEDILPAGTTLLGFVDDADLASGATRPETTVDLAGNLQATLDAAAGTVVVSQKDGTSLPNVNPYVNFKIELTDPRADVGIVNRIGGTQAVITPSNGFPLLIQKADALRPDVSITDRDARFTVTGPDGEVVTDEAFVVNGQLMVLGDDGEETGIVIPAVTPTVENPDGVPVGDYTVVETRAPAGYELPADEADRTVVATIDDDGSSSAVTLFDEPSVLYALGDRTWIDADRDGVQDPGEDALEGVQVDLLDGAGAVIRTTTTDASGNYLFDLLPAGDYRVRFTLTDAQAAQYAFAPALRGGDATRDSDADPATGESGVITLDDANTRLVPGTSYPDGPVQALRGIDPTWDAGVVQKTYAIGDHTWIDADRDGLQDAGEPVLPGVTVELLDENGDPAKHVDGVDVSPTTTDADGHYLFDDLPAGDYRVRFTLTGAQSEQYVFTTDGAGSATDSDAVVSAGDQAVGETRLISLGDDDANLTKDYDVAPVGATEGIDPTWDAGVVARSYAIGDTVWIDENRDGLQDAGEPALEGTTVELVDPATGATIATRTTDADGKYVFDELPAGQYQVRFTLTDEQAAELRFTVRDAASGDPDADSDADPATGITSVVALGPGDAELTTDDAPAGLKATDGIDPTWDAGVIRKTYAVGDRTWIDADRDGVQDPTEPALPGVTVELLDGDGDPVPGAGGLPRTTTTDANGRYVFDELPAGSYQLRFVLTEEQAATYTFTTIDAGDDDAGDSDASRGTGLTVAFTLDDASGALVPGDEYALGTVTATEGIDPTWDAGVVEKTYAVGDVVWIDSDRDGVQDEGEPVAPGVTVDLVDPETGSVLATTATDDDGRYLFDGLPAGDYQIGFTLTPEQAKRYVFTGTGAGGTSADSDAVPVTGRPGSALSRAFSLGDDDPELTHDYDRALAATEGVDPTWDAGIVLASVEIGDLVWIDEDGDGVQDPGEPPIPGVVLVLTGPDGGPVTDVHGERVGPRTTDGDGRYLFSGLPVLEDGQRYTVSIDRAASEDALRGLVPTIEGSGDRGTDSSQWTATSASLTVDGDQDLTLDFGFVRVPVAALPVTGGTVPVGLIAGGALLLLVGVGLLTIRRRMAR